MMGERRGRLSGFGKVIVLAAMAAGSWAASARGELPIEQEPINYLTAPVADPVSRLQDRIGRGEVALKHRGAQGYLKSLLEQLGISPESQALVFSKTSFQAPRISPRMPRAIYFNDDTYVGWVRGGDYLEIATIDPKLGPVFYLLDQEETERPVFERQTHSCLQCHQSSKTQEVPGLVVRSVYPGRTGTPIFSAGSFVTGHDSPLSERWGGWYVTGTHGRQRHLGNVVFKDVSDPAKLVLEEGANVTDLNGLVDTGPYPSDHSDIAALMVLEHQTQMHNAITAAGYHARIAMHQEEEINKALGRPAGSVSASTARRINSPVEKLVRYLLFSGETRLTDPIEGTSGFAAQFAARGPRDGRGRSLRDFDLQTRMFRYPCSYLIYSEAFDALPKAAKDQAYRRLREVLTGQDQTPAFAHLSADDRRAILDILTETKPDLPDDWKAGASSCHDRK
jgi:hypothetical protein